MPSKTQYLSDMDVNLSLLRAYIDSANDGIFVVCDEMKFHVANPLLTEWLGVTEATLTAHHHRLPITHFLGNAENEKLFSEYFQKVLQGEPVRFGCRIQPQDAAPRWVEISLNKVNLEVGDLVIGVMRDVTERVEMIGIVQHYACHDELTGLVNRREFERRLAHLFGNAKKTNAQHMLIYLDLDQFKLVNDTCGHMAGDELLRRLAIEIKEQIRKGDTFARLGGDEFGVLLENCPTERALEVAEKLRRTISGFRFKWQDRFFEVGASIGLCAITADSESPASVLSDADAACYVAKDNGRNRVQLYFSGRGEMNWVARINQAMEENRLCMYYQKIAPISGAGKGIAHFEVLLRLIDETGNVVVPAVFLPAAEKYNLMPAIDRWVVRHMLAAGEQRWKNMLKTGDGLLEPMCAINLSGASINDDGFPAFLREQLAASGIPPKSICFEITETVAISHLQRAIAFMHELKEIGCHISLDDFGSGMSSFSYLKSLPFDYLKIDGSLVKNIATNRIDLAMVESINRIGHLMGIQTIAEFVENDAILARLRAIGVDYAQGYGLHKPEPLQD